jgi:hypothetical protein
MIPQHSKLGMNHTLCVRRPGYGSFIENARLPDFGRAVWLCEDCLLRRDRRRRVATAVLCEQQVSIPSFNIAGAFRLAHHVMREIRVPAQMLFQMIEAAFFYLIRSALVVEQVDRQRGLGKGPALAAAAVCQGNEAPLRSEEKGQGEESTQHAGHRSGDRGIDGHGQPEAGYGAGRAD